MDQTQRQRYVSRFEPLALHPRLHHREGFLIHYLPPREPPPRRICYNSFKNFFLKPENREKLAQKNLAKNPKKWGLYSPNQKTSR